MSWAIIPDFWELVYVPPYLPLTLHSGTELKFEFSTTMDKVSCPQNWRQFGNPIFLESSILMCPPMSVNFWFFLRGVLNFDFVTTSQNEQTRTRRPPELSANGRVRIYHKLAEGMGFEPMVGCPTRHFQCRTLRPLGHPSVFSLRHFQEILHDFQCCTIRPLGQLSG